MRPRSPPLTNGDERATGVVLEVWIVDRQFQISSQCTFEGLRALHDRRERAFDLCVYCVGIGEPFDELELSRASQIMRANRVGATDTAAVVLSAMVQARRGHFIESDDFLDCRWRSEAKRPPLIAPSWWARFARTPPDTTKREHSARRAEAHALPVLA